MEQWSVDPVTDDLPIEKMWFSIVIVNLTQGMVDLSCGRDMGRMIDAVICNCVDSSVANKNMYGNVAHDLQTLNVSSDIPRVWCYLCNVLPMLTSLQTVPD